MDKRFDYIIGARDLTGTAVRSVLRGFGRIQAGAAALTAGIAAALGVSTFASGIASAVTEAADLERGIAEIGAVTGGTREELDALKETAIVAGRESKFQALQAAEAQQVLARAGRDVLDINKLLPSVLNLATAENLGLAESAGFVNDALNIFGIEVENAGRVTDVLARAAQLADTNVRLIGSTLSQSALVGRDAGLTFEQVAASVDVLAKNTIRGERAGTALRSIFSQLQDPASKFRAELRRLGDDSGDFIQAIETLEQAGPRANDAILAIGLEAGPALRAFVSEGIDGFREFERELLNSAGTTDTASKRIGDNFKGLVTSLESALSAVRQAVGEPLLEPIQEELRILIDDIRAFAADGSATAIGEQLARSFRSAAASVREFLTTFDLQESITGAIGQIEELGAIINTVLGSLQVLFGSVRFLFNGIQLAVSLVATAISLVLGGIAAGVLGITQALNAVGIVSDETVRSIENIARVPLDAAKNGIEQIELQLIETGSAGQSVLDGLGRLGEGAAAAGEGVKAGLEPAKQAAKETAAEIDKIDDSLSSIGNIDTQVDELFAKLLKDAQDLQAEGEDLGTVLERVLNNGGTGQALLDVMDALIEKTGTLPDGFEDAVFQLQKLLEQLREAENAGDTYEQLVEKSKEFADSNTEAAQRLRNLIESGADLPTLARAYEQARDSVQGLSEKQVEAGESADELAKKANIIDANFQKLGVESTREVIKGLDEAGDAFDQIASTGEASANDLTRSFSAYVNAVRPKLKELTDEQRKTTLEAIETRAELAGVGDTFAGVADQFKNAEQASGSLASGVEKIDTGGKAVQKTIGGITAAFDGSLESVLTVSAAIEESNNKRDAAARATRGVVIGQRDLNDEIDATVAKWGEVNDNVNIFGDLIDEQGFKLKANGERISAVSQNFLRELDAVNSISDRINDALAGGGESLALLTQEAREVNSQIDELGSKQLEPFNSLIQQAENRVRGLADAVQSLQEQADQRTAELEGNGEENRVQADLAQQLERLNELREQGATGTEELERQIRANAARELESVREQQRAEEEAEAERRRRDAARDEEQQARRRREVEGEREKIVQIDTLRDAAAERERARARKTADDIEQSLQRQIALVGDKTAADTGGIFNRNNPPGGELVRQLNEAGDTVRRLSS